MTPDEHKAWDDFVKRWSPDVKPNLNLEELEEMTKQATSLRTHPFGLQAEVVSNVKWRPGLKPDIDLSHVDISRMKDKPFLTAKDFVFLREMKVSL